ncbi:MAG: phosphoribosylformylglycinamidine synthase subunit PurS [Candidatus Kryptoniota bacterium]
MYAATIKVTLRKKILDPQGKVVENSLHNLNFSQFRDVRVGKIIEMTIDVDDESEARKLVDSACKKLLANPVTEDFEYEVHRI